MDKEYAGAIFTRAQEQALANHIADMAAAGTAMTKGQIMEVFIKFGICPLYFKLTIV